MLEYGNYIDMRNGKKKVGNPKNLYIRIGWWELMTQLQVFCPQNIT